MAQLLTPIRADVILKFKSASSSAVWSGHQRSRLGDDRRLRINGRWRRCWRRREVRVTASVEDSISDKGVADDYYSVLGLWPDATPHQIKKAYYNCMKACHPDLSGDDPDITNFCIFINEVYEVLSDPMQRMVYDEIHGHGYALSAINPFLDDTAPRDHAFVDEFSCIGCKNCANVAPDVFQIEEVFGRARVCNQSGNPAQVQEAIDTCPVDCIHWTSAAQLSLLEDEMRRVERVNVGVMLAGMGGSSDVFRMARFRWEKRQSKVLEKARIRMMKQKGSVDSGAWTNLWGKPKDYQNTEDEAKERAKRAAAATRRWREYSRKGTDRPPTLKLPEAMGSKE